MPSQRRLKSAVKASNTGSSPQSVCDDRWCPALWCDGQPRGVGLIQPEQWLSFDNWALIQSPHRRRCFILTTAMLNLEYNLGETCQEIFDLHCRILNTFCWHVDDANPDGGRWQSIDPTPVQLHNYYHRLDLLDRPRWRELDVKNSYTAVWWCDPDFAVPHGLELDL